MKALLFLLLLGVLTMSSCKKKDICEPSTFKAPESEINALRTILDNQNVTYTEDSRGFFYEIKKLEDGEKPDVCSTVRVKYELRLMNGNIIESTPDVTFQLGSLILGWQMGIPLIGKGSSIILYLPPALAYGDQSSANLPANSNLIFEIELLDVL
jgi:FKBP-type peptidyl-prolyl cis-trans isomerase FkpA